MVISNIYIYMYIYIIYIPCWLFPIGYSLLAIPYFRSPWAPKGGFPCARSGPMGTDGPDPAPWDPWAGPAPAAASYSTLGLKIAYFTRRSTYSTRKFNIHAHNKWLI